MPTRESAFAGRFYPKDPTKLKRTIENLFHHELGPGDTLSGPVGERRALLGVTVPHAGYRYSGPIAAHAYYELFQDGLPDTFIILGPNHSRMGNPISVFSKGAWRTPLGEVKIDEELASALIEGKPLSGGKMAHSGEHSIEVQLPFLQFVFQKDFKIVPIACMNQNKEKMKAVTEQIIQSVEETERDIAIIASTDMSHYVSYEKAQESDRRALKLIENLEIGELYEMIAKDYSMCGYGPTAVLMGCAKHWDALGGTLAYATSGDVTGDKSQVVGYATVAFTQIKPEKEKERKKEKIKEKPVPM